MTKNIILCIIVSILSITALGSRWKPKSVCEYAAAARFLSSFL